MIRTLISRQELTSGLMGVIGFSVPMEIFKIDDPLQWGVTGILISFVMGVNVSRWSKL